MLLCVSLAILLSIVMIPPTAAHVCQPDPEIGVSGSLLVPNGSGLALISFSDRALRPLAIAPGAGVVNHVARSPDGSRLAVARFSRAPADPVGGSDVLIVGPDGGEPLTTIARRELGELLGAPAWLPDGGLVFDRQTIAGAAGGSRLERVEADGSNRRPMLERAAAPAVSPDGQSLAFVRNAAVDRLMLRPLEGGPETVLVDDPSFLALIFPHFSPDGRWIAFGAAGGPAAQPLAPATLGRPLPLVGTRPALAHGVPADIWAVHPDGSALHRLTSFFDDDPAPAWSPDGRWVAAYSGESITINSTEGRGSYCLLGSGGYGVAEWIAE